MHCSIAGLTGQRTKAYSFLRRDNFTSLLGNSPILLYTSQIKLPVGLQGRILQCFNYFAASRGKVTVRESQQTRGSGSRPCLSNSSHERSAECVCLCLMFTVPNERVAKNSLLTGHNLQWRWTKAKMALLGSYCTYSVRYKASPLATSVTPPQSKPSKNTTRWQLASNVTHRFGILLFQNGIVNVSHEPKQICKIGAMASCKS